MTVDEAISIVARHVVATAVSDFVGEAWELYPEIGERDWLAVADEADSPPGYPPYDKYREAYALLEKRAQDWEKENHE